MTAAGHIVGGGLTINQHGPSAEDVVDALEKRGSAPMQENTRFNSDGDESSCRAGDNWLAAGTVACRSDSLMIRSILRIIRIRGNAMRIRIESDRSLSWLLVVGIVGLTVSACTQQQQVLDPVKQFGAANVAAAAADDALLASADKAQANLYRINLLDSDRITPDNDGWPTSKSAANVNPILISDADHKAIGTVLNAIKAYGDALQGLATDTAATDFGSNVDALGQALLNVDTNVLTPLGAKGLPSKVTVADVGTAIKAIGNIVVSHLIASDVQAAARQADAPLHTIAATLQGINNQWAKQGQNAIAQYGNVAYRVVNKHLKDPVGPSELQTWIDVVQHPISADPANTALDALVTANGKIATAGPTASESIAYIQAAVMAANDAITAYRTVLNK
jgi:hypothetical protein